MSKKKELTGMVFGKLTVKSYYGKNNHRQSLWNCICECGNEKVILGPSLLNGRTFSCGCYNIEKIKERRTTHGHKKGKKATAEYKTWASMISRCTNPNSESYKYYGGRGITVCESWKDFSNFISDMGNKPSPRHSIDRIDVNGNYEPNNCRWSTKEQQARNIRLLSRNRSGQHGVVWNQQRKKWQARIRSKKKDVHLGLFNNLEDAIQARKEAELKYHALT